MPGKSRKCRVVGYPRWPADGGFAAVKSFRQQTANEQIAAGGFIAGEGGTWLWVTGWECLGRSAVQAG